MIVNCEIGGNVIIWNKDLVNLYGCFIGDDCSIGHFVEIGRGVIIGDNCKIQSNVYIPPGILIKNNVFIGPGVVFTNDKYPPSMKKKWESSYITLVLDNVSIGAGAIILPGVTLYENAKIGAGAVVTKSVLKDQLVYGNPARVKLLERDKYNYDKK